MNASKKSSVLDGYVEKENLIEGFLDVQWKEKLFSALLKKIDFQVWEKKRKGKCTF